MTNEYVYEEIDHSTGKVVTSKRKATYKTRTINKKYFMFSLDSKWHRKIKANDLQLLAEMIDLEHQTTWEVHLHKKTRDKICKNLDCSTSQIMRSLKNMVDNNILAKVEPGVYLINPECVWIGSSEIHEKKVDNYMQYANLEHYLEKT